MSGQEQLQTLDQLLSAQRWDEAISVANAALVRNPRHFAVLSEFLRDSKQQSAAGIYLASDRRRYLNLSAMTAIVGDQDMATSLLDHLLDKGLLHRGTILKCQYCRTAAWFTLSDSQGCMKAGVFR